jgi:hypothetical protein
MNHPYQNLTLRHMELAVVTPNMLEGLIDVHFHYVAPEFVRVMDARSGFPFPASEFSFPV